MSRPRSQRDQFCWSAPRAGQWPGLEHACSGGHGADKELTAQLGNRMRRAFTLPPENAQISSLMARLAARFGEEPPE